MQLASCLYGFLLCLPLPATPAFILLLLFICLCLHFTVNRNIRNSKGELLHVALLTKSLFILPKLRQILSNSLTSKCCALYVLLLFIPSFSEKTTHQHKVMALFA